MDAALAGGHEVTTFRRGLTGDDAPGVEVVRGDRTDVDDLARLAAGGPWDVVVDTSGYVPREVGAVARALSPVVGRYVFVSSVSAYVGWPVEPLTETSELLDCPADAAGDYGHDGDPGPSVYGFTKVGCERAVTDAFGADRVTILRPGVILGPREYVGRLPWWLNRVARGGRVLAPGSPDRPIQPVDVRDVAEFALAAPTGVFNVTAPGTETFGDFLAACVSVACAGEPHWVPDEFLVAQGLRQWTEIPLWRTYAGAWAVDSSRARAAGLRTRPLIETVRDTWAWMGTKRAVEHERAGQLGIDPEKEAAVLDAWQAGS
ncbi:NAD-dependent epimerase/dehydratase family protein [Saccharothrix violaceirubra]|uniref:Nucleoside-diphosphate-sugar epimerase n=1 Tax=Saccharothrix violaceirubra TaxID=413306 RepID=A0A7W7SYQ9_9PSEU|nr:nucleoside-diphosphate-sugar epimerase [Saccharothrix violaceirubra]